MRYRGRGDAPAPARCVRDVGTVLFSTPWSCRPPRGPPSGPRGAYGADTEEGGPIVAGQGDATSGGQPGAAGGQGGAPAGAAGPTDDVVGWVHQHCRKVPAEQWRSVPGGDEAAYGPGGSGGTLLGETLFDCGARGE